MEAIVEDVRWLVLFEPSSELYAIWRGSLIDDLLAHGYSNARAEQVIDELMRWVNRQ